MKKRLLYYLSLTFFPVLTIAQTNTFPSSGNVGIGTLSPTWPLDVRGRISSNEGVVITNPLNASASLTVNWLDDIARVRIGGNGSGASNGFDIQGTSNRSLMRFLNNGNIGIGTSSPLSKGSYRILDISGSSSTDGGYIRLATSDASGEAHIFTTDSRLIFDLQKPGMYFHWRNASDQQIYRLNQDGTAIWNGNASSYTQISSNSNGQYLRQYANDGSTQSWIIRGYANNGVQAEFHEGGVNVNGTLRSKEVKVTLDGWSDYVFNEDYNLIPLKELEDFILTHNHLPGIPTEADVRKEGLNLGEINAKLLEKIEELTLYLIAQERELVELRELKKEVQDLRDIINNKDCLPSFGIHQISHK